MFTEGTESETAIRCHPFAWAGLERFAADGGHRQLMKFLIGPAAIPVIRAQGMEPVP